MIKNLFKGFKKKKEDEINEVEVILENESSEKKIEVEFIEEEKIEEEKKINESIKKESDLKTEDIKEEILKEEKEIKKSVFQSLKERLSKSREGFFSNLKKVFTGRTVIDDEMYEDLEDLLIQSDIGFDMTLNIVQSLEDEVKKRKVKDPELVYGVLKEVLESYLIDDNNSLELKNKDINVILVVGVNGVGKTTTIGKLALKLKNEGKKVIIGAADTFRAAAVEQLEEWALRSKTEIVKHEQGADPGAVVFDTLKVARNKKADVAIIDTAGRLHNKNNLMAELAKINKIIQKDLGEDTFYESLLVIDGTTGQNGLTQAKVFNEVTTLTGFVISKLDGTAKGGIVFAISKELNKPVKFIGVGEGINDLREFNAKEFINAIFE